MREYLFRLNIFHIVEHGNNEAGIMPALIFYEHCDAGVVKFTMVLQIVYKIFIDKRLII